MRELGKPLQVYVVEDSAVIQRLLASTIAAAGGELIGQSADAESAIKALSKLKADLVLIDIALKSGTGFDVLEALQTLDRRSMPIRVVLTNYASPEYEQLSYRMGANGFFDKDTQMSEALTLIGALVAEKRGRALAAARSATRNKPQGPTL